MLLVCLQDVVAWLYAVCTCASYMKLKRNNIPKTKSLEIRNTVARFENVLFDPLDRSAAHKSSCQTRTYEFFLDDLISSERGAND
jgi:hypothetical protein